MQMIGMETCLVPDAAVERGVRVSVPGDLSEALENGLVALARRHGLALRKPVTRARFGKIVGVVRRRKGPLFHSSPSRSMSSQPPQRTYFGPRSATIRRIVSTITSGGVSWS